MSKKNVEIVMGGAQFGPDKPYETSAQIHALFEVLKRHKVTTIDSAQLYTGSEQLLGSVDAGSQFTIDTKASGGFKPGALKSDLMVAEADESLKKLKVKQVDIFYIHAPDPNADMADYLSGIQQIYEKGTFRRFGLSNFQAGDVEKVYNHCKKNNYVLPTVYQGNYNAVARKQETLLFPTLRKLGLSFYAYSPIAGGFLTKTRDEVTGGAGRFVKGTPVGDMYLNMYGKESLLDVLTFWEDLAKKEGISKAEMAYRWVRFHSALSGEHGDKLIMAARTPERVEETLVGLEKGPLSKECANGIDEIWKKLEESGDAPLDNYHR